MQLKKFTLLTILLCLATAFLSLGYARTLTESQRNFVDFMIPKIEKANHNILTQRKKLIHLYQNFKTKSDLTWSQKTWLNALAKQYGLKKISFNQYESWQELLSRVDIVPVSLVLAQAINESAWGRPRFAREGNNYFGQWCSAPGCGLVPKKRKPGSPWQVQKFSNAYQSIVSYLNNINKNRAYSYLRRIRYELRETGQALDPNKIALGLNLYSQRGEQYVTIMQNIINQFQLAQVVKHYNQNRA